MCQQYETLSNFTDQILVVCMVSTWSMAILIQTRIFLLLHGPAVLHALSRGLNYGMRTLGGFSWSLGMVLLQLFIITCLSLSLKLDGHETLTEKEKKDFTISKDSNRF